MLSHAWYGCHVWHTDATNALHGHCRTRETAAHTAPDHPPSVTSGWLLKTGHTTGTGNWKPHKWSSRFFVMMGGTLYYFRPQAMAQAAGCIELSDSVQVCAGVSLRSPPSGSFTLTLPPVSRGHRQRGNPTRGLRLCEAGAVQPALALHRARVH